MNGDLLYCNNIQELMEELQPENVCEQWSVIINSSKVSLNAMLLHSGSKFPAIRLTLIGHIKVM
jgi:hypothetical protein